MIRNGLLYRFRRKYPGILLGAALTALAGSTAFGQSDALVISGSVIDTESGEAVPFATVVAHQINTFELVTGTTTDGSGNFSFISPSDQIYLLVSFLGYRTDTITDLQISNGRADIGKLYISPNQEQLREVEIVGEVSRTTFKLDKRVFNVGKDLSTTGASALQVLDNVPSVNVSIEGNITLRGSGGVQILIDGKPSVLADDPNALGMISADMIESVEVITNPSAKYDASGTSGILNIVLKKEEKNGLNGSISLNTGAPDNHSIGVSLNGRTRKFNLFAQMGAGYRSLPQYYENINEDRTDSTTIANDGTGYRNETFYNITLGADYRINEKNVLTLSGRFAYEIEDSPSRTFFRQSDGSGISSQWFREEVTEATNPKWQFDLQYKKEFNDNEDHTFMVSALGSYFGKDQSSVFTNTTTFGPVSFEDQLTDTEFQRADYTLKLDYTDPITDRITIETGAQYVLNDVGNDFAVQDRIDNDFVIDPDLTNDFDWDQKVLGVYGTGSYEGDKAGVKIGLRLENTDLKTLLATTDERNAQNYTNLFPSVHGSYKVSDRFSLQAGYSRRVSRPRLWDLNPFFNIRNNFNIRTGNPDLQPEFTDSYEITSILLMAKFSLNGSIYHRFTTDVVERVSTFENNVNTTTPMNIGTNATTGFELTGKYDPKKWLSFNGDFNINGFDRKGEFEETSFDFSGNQWTSRLSAKFKLPYDIELETSGNYRSGYQTVQGDVSGFAFADFGARKKLVKGKLVANVSIRDIFESRISESIIDQADFFLYSFSQRGRFITFGLSYALGKGEAMSYSGGRRR
jgi:outer membrane receptor protein involved in Fe transport